MHQYSNLSLNNDYKQENINENTVVNQFKQFFRKSTKVDLIIVEIKINMD